MLPDRKFSLVQKRGRMPVTVSVLFTFLRFFGGIGNAF